MSKLILTSLENATNRLQEALELPADDIVRDAVVKRFEYTNELCFKFLKRSLKEFYDLNTETTYKNILKEGLKYNLILNLELWEEARNGRNYSAHDYSLEISQSNYLLAPKFLTEAKNLIDQIHKLNTQN